VNAAGYQYSILKLRALDPCDSANLLLDDAGHYPFLIGLVEYIGLHRPTIDVNGFRLIPYYRGDLRQ
jgi:hypothetical protein